MTDTPAEPDWSLLPHNPLGFFGLTADCDQRELKRSYNELIRRFKPERFPQEFQRIRAAYEQLESALRYGQSIEAAPSADEPAEWIQIPARSLAARPQSERGAGFSAPPPLHERIRTGDIAEIYRELEDRPGKTPYDYYALAVMADAVGEGEAFVDWVLKGLTEFPNEIGLSRLLHAYFGSVDNSEACEAFVISCSTIIREDLYFPLTEPLWKQLLRSQDFSRFRTLLSKCEANLKGIHVDNRLAFYLQILKPAVWLADSEWINASYDFIDQNFSRIPKNLDYELEVLGRLRAYIAIRDQFVGSDEIRQRLDRAMCDYFSEEQLKGDQSVLECQTTIAQDAEKLGAAFAEFGNRQYATFFELWIWISVDVSQRHVVPQATTVDERVWHLRTKTLLDEIARKTKRSTLGIKWSTRRVTCRLSQFFGFVLAPMFLSAIAVGLAASLTSGASRGRGDDGPIAFGTLLGVVVGVLVAIWMSKRIDRHYWQPFTLRISAECYRRLWQREIFSFLAVSQLSYQTFRSYVHSFRTAMKSTPWVRYYVDQDFALPMFVIANRFVV